VNDFTAGVSFTVEDCFGRLPSSVRFTSRVDSKGRVLVGSEIRRLLRLKFGTPITADVDGKEFSTKVDERGRFSVPLEVRKGSAVVEGEVRRCLQ